MLAVIVAMACGDEFRAVFVRFSYIDEPLPLLTAYHNRYTSRDMGETLQKSHQTVERLAF